MSMSFDRKKVTVLHIEPTTVCQAACPQCDRENLNLYTDHNRSELTVEQIKKIIDEDFILQLKKMFMCGNFGEPAAAKDCLEIFKHFKMVNPNIVIGLNTNGGVRSKTWWADLAKTMNGTLDYVVFSIDGLKDTNHIYRRNVNWNKLMSNVESFISNGGSAHWDMLIFEHNQHQVNQALDLATKMGFTWFRTKVTKRFDDSPVEFLKPPLDFVDPNVKNPKAISCLALEEQSLFLAANGQFLPCCHIGPYIFNIDRKSVV